MDTPFLMSRHRVVVVATASEHRACVTDLLESLGCEVTEITDGSWAVALSLQTEVPLVVVEHGAESIDAPELIESLVRGQPETVVVAFGVDDTIATAVKLVRRGAANYLPNPGHQREVARKALFEALGEALHKPEETPSPRPVLPRHDDMLSAMLDQLPQGMALLDNRGRVVFANQQAREILEAGEGLGAAPDNTLTAASDLDTALLRGLLANAVRDAGPDHRPTGGALTIDRAGEQAPLSLLLLPLGPSEQAQDGQEPVVAVLISDPDRRHEPTERTLRRLYGLTRAEARLTAVLAQGKTTKEAAAELSIAESTAKTHQRNVLSKTNTRRRADLVSLLLSGPALFGQKNAAGPAPGERSGDKQRKPPSPKRKPPRT